MRNPTLLLRLSKGVLASVVFTGLLIISPVVNAAPPVAEPDAYTADYETPLVVNAATGVLSNDTDADVGDVLTAVLGTDVSNGTLSLGSDGAFTYTPGTGFSGTDSFDYVANDGTVDSAVTTVTLSVNSATNSIPIAVADAFNADFETQLVVNAATGVLSNDSDADPGDVLTAVLGTDVSNGTLSLGSDGAFTYTPDTGFTGTDSFDYVANDGTVDSAVASVTLSVASTGNGVVEVWYGANQQIGNVGQPQSWANILGNVSDPDGVASLSYSLNGGVSQTMSIGPDGSRLLATGDFNADLDRAQLNTGSNQVEITAVDTLGNPTSTTVSVTYTGGTVWPDTYQVDWSQTAAVQDAVEVYDGQWEITPNGIRTLDPGYDRLFGIGDVGWDQYELVSDFTLHSFDANEFAGVGVIGPWNGHTDDPIAGAQPKVGFLPFGSQTWTAYFPPGLPSRIQTGGHLLAKVKKDFTYALDQKYNFRYRVERPSQNSLQYSARVWEDGSPEPTGWDVQYTDVTSGLVDGSVTFVAHYADVTFGDIAVVPVTSPPPAAFADTYTAVYETTLAVDAANGVLANDTGGNATLTAVLDTDASNGTLVLDSDGSFDYTPATGFIGLDAFSYHATDGQTDSTPVQVNLSVADPNADSELLVHLTLDDDQTATVATDSSLYGNSGVITGATYVSESGDGSSASLEFDNSDTVKIDGLDVNGTGVTLAAWVKADTFPGNNKDPRIISKARGIAANSHVFMLSTTKRGSSNDVVLRGRVRVGGVTTTYRANTGLMVPGAWYHTAMVYNESTLKLYLDGVEVASAAVTGPVDQDSSIGVGIGSQPNGGYHWDGRIDDVRIAQRPYSAVEIQALAALGGGGNTGPLGIADAYNGFSEEPLTVPAATGVLVNDSDADGDVLTATLARDVSTGTLVLNADGSFTYTPDSGFIGTDSFDYVASDGTDDSGIVTVTLTIAEPLNEAPVAVADVYATTMDTASTVDAASGVLSNDTDADVGDVMTAVLDTDVSHGALSLSADGSFVYTPDTGFTGTDTFRYRASDGKADSQIVTVTVQVNSATNQVPLASGDSYNVEYETELSVDAISGVLANDTDADAGDVLTTVLDADVSNGVLVFNADGSFTYTPAPGFGGTDSFTYHATDDVDDSAIVQVDLEVEPPFTDTDLLAHLTLDDDQTPAIATDSSVNGNNGVITGATYVLESGDGSPASLEFDNSDTVKISGLDVNGTGVTLAAWVKADTFPGSNKDSRIISKARGIAANTHVFMLSTTKKGSTNDVVLRGRVRVGGSTTTFRANTGEMSPGVWYHTAMVYDESTLKLYLDGVEVASAAVTGPVDQDSSIDVGIGSQPNGGYHWDGRIDDVRIAQRPFSGVELQAIVAAGTGGVGAPVAIADSYAVVVDQQLAVIATNGVLVNDIDAEGDSLTAILDANVTNGSLTLNADGSFIYIPDAGFIGVDSFTYTANDGINNSSTATVQITVGPAGDSIIEAWYGSNQSFGNIGHPQVWANVLGNVSDADGVSSLSYTLNGGASRSLSIGSDVKRLFYAGDFNIDLAREDLLEGANLVEITAVDLLNSITRTTVTVNYSGLSEWPETYQVDWSQVASLQDGAEILDGKWELTPEGIRTVETGYDRLFAIGEMSWDQYELVSDFTLHSFDASKFAGVGVIGPWNGHTDDPIAGAQPKAGFLPFGSQTWTAYFPPGLPSRIQTGGHLLAKVKKNFTYALEQKYNFRYRVERPSQTSLRYSARVWADGAAEPTGWDVQYTDITSGLTEGSVVFVAHYADVTFGNIAVVPVTSPPPAAVADSYNVAYETTLSVDAANGVLANDTGGNAALTAVLDTDTSNGTLVLDADGSFDYTPATGFFGLDAFSYHATDGQDSSIPVQVNLSVADPNADSELLVHLTLDDDQTATVATDSSLYGNSGEISGATYVAETIDGSTASLEFDNTDTVKINGLDVNGTGVTLAAWVKADSFPGVNNDPRIISKAKGVAANTHVFMLSTAKRGSSNDVVLRGRVRVGGVTTTYRANTGLMVPGAWYHTAMVYDESTLKLYLDGVEVASASVTGPVDQDSSIGVGIGSQPNGGYHWDGRIDDVRIAQRPYSAVEIQALAALGGGGNTGPLGVADAYNGFSDELLTVPAASGVLANDSDADGNALAASLATDVSNGTLVLNADGSFTYTPDSGFIGTDSFDYVASDGTDDSGIVTVTLTIEAPPNEVPVAVADVYATTMDTASTVDAASGVLSNDTDADVGDVLTAVLDTDVSHGTLSLSTDGSFVYTPDTGFTGTDTFDYRANDGTDDSEVVTVTLQVNSATNQVPLASGDAYNVEYETVLSVDAISGVLVNDTDADAGDVLTAVLDADVSNGTLVFNADGSFTYTPAPGFGGTDSFTYHATDSVNDSAVVQVDLEVASPFNDSDLLVHLTLDDDQTPAIATDSSVNANNGAITGATYVSESGDGSSASLQFDGTDSVNLGGLDVNGTGVTLAAWIKADSFPGANKDPRIISKAAGIATNTQVFMLSASKKGSADEVVLRGSVRVGGVTTSYRANTGDLLPGVWYHTAMVYDESTLKLYLDGVEVASADVIGPVDQDSNVDVVIGSQANDSYHWDGLIDDVRIAQRPFTAQELQAIYIGGRPVTTDDSYALIVDQQLVTTVFNGVLANDTDDDPLTANLNTNVTNGVLIFNSDGSFTYTPDSGFTGTDTFTYLATDGSETSRVTTVELIMAPVGDSTIDVWYGANQEFGNIGQPQTWINVLGNASDLDGITSLSYALNGGANQPLSLGTDGRRLLNDGDFNVDIDRALLLEGANEVVITAIDSLNSITRATVTVNYTGGTVWPESYFADWSQATSLSDGVEILDGKWELTPSGIRTTEIGYDRLFAVGNVDWTRYELVSTFTVHSYDANEYAGLGVIGPWTGHTDDPIAGAQPKSGFLPYGAQTWAAYFPPGLQSRIQVGGHQTAKDIKNYSFSLGQTYNFRYRVESPTAAGLQHSARVWPVGSAEPVIWDVQFTDTTSNLTEGSVAFVAHFADVTFGNITVQPISGSAPLANADGYSTEFETTLTVDAANGVLANDTGGIDTLSAVLDVDVSNGTLILNSDGSFTYTPLQDYFGLDSFSYYATDGDTDSFSATVNLSIVDPNADPDLLAHLTFDDYLTPAIAADSSIYGNSGVILGAQYVSETSDGSQRSLEFNGSDSVNLSGLDVNGTGITLAAWIKADSFPGANQDPRIISKANGVIADKHVFALSTASKGSSTSTVLRGRVRIGGTTKTYRASQGVLETGVWYHVAMTYDESEIKLYVDGVEVAAAVFTEGGPVDQDSNVDVAIGSQPGGGFHWDGRIDDVRIAQRALPAAEIQALAALNTGGNFVPVSSEDAYAVITNQQLVVPASAGVLANDSDGDDEPLSVSLESDVSNGTLSFNADGSFSYLSSAGFVGTDTFRYRATDGTDFSSITTVTLTVDLRPNDAPVVNADQYLAVMDTVLTVDAATGVLANDSDFDGDPLTAVLDTDVSSGTLLLNSDGSFTYTPSAGFSGTDTFRYFANDNRANSEITTVVLPVNSPTNQVPIASGDEYITDFETTLLVDTAGGVLANDSDLDAGDVLTASLATDVSSGTLVLNTDGSFTYTPQAGFSGIDTFSYIASDSIAGSAPTVVEISVNPEPNEPPLAVAEGYSTPYGTVLYVDAVAGLLANDTDADGDSLTSVVNTNVSNGSLSLDSDGSFTYIPATGFGGSDSFTYYATDGKENSAPAQVLLEVGYPPFFAGDGVYDSDVEVTYKEYWISHEWFTGGDDCAASPEGNKTYIEPHGFASACPMYFNIGDDFSNALKAEIYMDIWRGRTDPSVRFNLNGGITRQPDVGEDWSRTPYIGDIPLSELVTGTNVLNLWTQGGAYHVKDIAIRIYHTSSKPLLSNGVRRAVPQAFLVSVEDDNKTVSNMSTSNVLAIDNDKLTLTAFATKDARFLEFHAFYDGYDEDNDGFSRDWHNRGRNNFHPGGVSAKRTGGTIDHIGTVEVNGAGYYSIEWDIPNMPAQSGVKFKVRVADSARDVRDAAGGVSAEFELKRETTNVQTFMIPNFQDGILYHDGLYPPALDRVITLPQDLSAFTEATIIASYWENPFLSINNNPDIAAFNEGAGEDIWTLSIKDIPMSYLQGGANLLTYKHSIGFGEFIEKPGPMIVLRGPAATAPVAPFAKADSYQVIANNQLSVNAQAGVLLNDSDANGDVMTVILQSDVTNGTLVLSSDGSFVYTPTSNFLGNDSFSYYVTDGGLNSGAVQVTIAITGPDGDPDLLVHLSLDDDDTPTVATDGSSYGNDGVISGAEYIPETGDGSSRSLEFSGSDSVNLGGLDAAGSGLTLAAWIKADSFPGSSRDPRIIAKASAAGPYYTIFMLSTYASGNSQKLQGRLRVGDVTTEIEATTGNLSTDVWYHTALIYDQSTVKLYLDGVEVASMPLTGAVTRDNSVDAAIGSVPGGGRHFDGKIDDVFILQRAISTTDLQSLVQEGTGGNGIPVANADSYTMVVDTVLTTTAANGVLANDTDSDGVPLTVTLNANVSNGTLNLSSDGAFTYTPPSGFLGTDSFSYVATDGQANSRIATVTLIVEPPPNDAPTAVADLYGASVDTVLTINVANGVLANDTDGDNDPLTAVLSTDVVHGTLNLIADGSFTYTPATGFTGTDTFKYFANDTKADSGIVTVTIPVSSPTNQVPVAVADAYQTSHDQVLVVGAASGLLANDTDSDVGDTLTTVLDAGVSTGTLSLNTDGSFTYVPTIGFGGVVTFSYHVTDGQADSAIVDVTLTIDGPITDADLLVRLEFDDNQDPNVAPDSGIYGNNGVVNGAIYVTDSGDSSIRSLEFESDDYVDVGAVDVNGSGLTVASWIKADSFPGSFRDPRIISKASGTSANDHIFMLSTVKSGTSETKLRARVRVGGVTTTLVADTGFLATGVWYHTALVYDQSTLKLYLNAQEIGSTALTGPVDQDGGMAVAIGSQPGGGNNFDGNIDDVRILQRAYSEVELLTIMEEAQGNTIPVSNNDAYNVTADQALDVTALTGVLANDTDANDDVLIALPNTGVTNGALTLNGDGSFTYMPNAGFIGTDTFTYFANDGADNSTSATVTLTVDIAPNEPPVATPDFYNANRDTVLSVDAISGVLSNDSDADVGDTLTATVGTSVSAGVLVLNTNGSFSFSPASGFSGTETFTYRASDGKDNSQAVTVTIPVHSPTNQVPVAATETYDSEFETELVIPAATGVLANDTDADVGDTLTAVLDTDVTSGTLTLNSDGSFSYIPDNNFNGNDSFGYHSTDGQVDSAVVQVVISVAERSIDPELLAHLEFEDFETPIFAEDSSGNGNFGVISGAEYVAETGDGSTRSMDFKGGDTIDLGEFDVAGTGLTLAAWIKADTFPGVSRDPRIISKASGTSANDHIFMLSTIKLGTQTVLRARIRVSGVTTTVVADSGTSLSTGVWHHVAVTHDGLVIRLYLDGIVVGAAPLSGSIDQNDSVTVAVGSQPGGGSYFDGKIDDVRIMQRGLTSTEIISVINGAPTTPVNLTALALTDSYIDLAWSTAPGVVAYRVFRNGVLIATVTDPSYRDTTAVTGVNYTYDVVALNAFGETSDAAQITATIYGSAVGNWWGGAWNYRSRIAIDSNNTAREDSMATTPMDFDALIVQAGGTGLHDPSRVRCVEISSSGALLNAEIRCQSSDGELVLLLAGNTAISTTRYFHVYFDEVFGGEDDTRPPLVTMTENVLDEGYDSLQIVTNTGSLYYHTGGAGISSLLDNNGLDWVSYNASVGGYGVFRGIPNLVPPTAGGFFHPGPVTATTTVVDSGPIRVRFESVSIGGDWRAVWDVYPDYLSFTLLDKPADNYWFQYEGTPGGFLDAGDSTVRSTGSASIRSGLDTWSGDIPGEEWVMVNASEVPRSMFLAKEDDDSAFDSYRPFSAVDGAMTVLGIGRRDGLAELTGTDETFFIGFLDTQDFLTARARIRSTIRALDVGYSSPVDRP